ncbi:hypothetical protein Pint_34694 [Pistacia integerrima]|uniref:Uncharacterized protein n=1 Tax=Pistacia integerrima TaxID=434235 RepID=A0ACC0X5W8_9ROSI|nr:hypothetical protein Pint_34694 [Pistacia integerrima]
MLGLDFDGYLGGSFPCPPKTITHEKQIVSNPDYRKWLRQDALIRHAILSSSTFAIQPSLNGLTTTAQAWKKLNETYANRSRTRYLTLRDVLSNISKEGKSVSEYMQAIKTVANDLALIGHPLTEDEIVHHVLRGLTSEFKEISAGIRARSEAISFEELHEKLSDHEMFLKLDDARKDSHQFTAQYSQRSSSNSSGRRYNNNSWHNRNPHNQNNNSRPQSPSNFQPFKGSGGNFQGNHNQGNKNNQQWNTQPWRGNSNNQPKTVCQLCYKLGHTARCCRTSPQTNYTASETNNNTNWIMDSGASHHITSDLQNMAIHSDYVGNDGIIIGDGSGIPITHTGSTTLSSCNSTFQLNNVLCAPSIKKNLICFTILQTKQYLY